MANDAAFKASLVWLAAVILVVGVCTQSMKKMTVTYVLGVAGIAGVILPDWNYFNREFSRWNSPIRAEERAKDQEESVLRRFSKSRVRVIIYIVVYAFSLYKWWGYVWS